MNIGLDYDNTYTRDPKMWDEFVKMVLMAGHTICCVTLRTPEQGEDVRNSIGRLIPCHFTSMQSKSKYMQALGISIDVWIDDMPDCISLGIETVNDGRIYL